MGTYRIRKFKNHRRVIAVICILILITGIVCGCLFIKSRNVPRTAHVSVDDATVIFMQIYREEPESIFEHAILAKLKALHEEYGLKVTLYVYATLDDFSMWDMPQRYKAEFRNNADWLKIGFHSIGEENPQATDITAEEFEAQYIRTQSAISRFAGYASVAHVLRLHYWYATPEMIEFLAGQGVTGLLCSEAPLGSYGLTEAQEKQLYESRHGVLEEDITYFVTDIRLENVEDITAELEERTKDHIIVLFTHAVYFEENYDKLEETLSWLVEEEYEFGFLEEEME